MALLNLNSPGLIADEEVSQVDSDRINFLDLVHPEIIKLLTNAKTNSKFISSEAYLNQKKIGFSCFSKTKHLDCILINKKAS